jgi:photosystem II stability/assembly factor-like uncharacterized protein
MKMYLVYLLLIIALLSSPILFPQPIAQSTSTNNIGFTSLSRKFGNTIAASGSVWSVCGLVAILKNGSQEFVTIPEAHQVRDAVFITETSGLVIADNKMLRTTDKGKVWIEVDSLKGKSLNRLAFASSLKGWALAANGEVFKTSDGGNLWTPKKCDSQTELIDLFSIDEKHVWIRNLGQELFISKDGGDTWRRASLYSGITSFIFINPEIGWAISVSNNILHTTDGGETWSISRECGSEKLRSIFFISPKEGWAVGNVILHTINGGRKWVTINTNSPSPLSQVVFTNKRFGYAINDNFDILISKNKGYSWSILNKWKKIIANKVYQQKFNRVTNR